MENPTQTYPCHSRQVSIKYAAQTGISDEGGNSISILYFILLGRLGFVDVIVSNILATKTNDAVFNASLNLLICLSEELEPAKAHINNSKEFPAGTFIPV